MSLTVARTMKTANTLCFANRLMSSSKETFRNWRTGEEVTPENHAEYVLHKLGMRVTAEKEETQDAIDAMIEWYFSGSDWEVVEEEEEEIYDGYDDYVDMLIDERLEARYGAF